jgi:hypothetical protein
MDTEPTNDSVIKSYVWHGDRCFFVSTIERTSSAVACQSRYNETVVWAFDWAANLRGGMLHQDSDAKGSIRTHQKVCGDFFAHGKPSEET